jgi:putative transposase
MKKQRHTRAEIAAKLEEADALIAGGKLQADVAKALGVSVMTYHRWRKARKSLPPAAPARSAEAASEASPIEQTKRINQLQLENARLRRLVTDLLLEKMNLEEGIQNQAHGANVAARR